jgi:hypothetical protein
MWGHMMERTWVPGQDIKRGDYALAAQRKREMVESYRTLNPDLQEAPKTVRVR